MAFSPDIQALAWSVGNRTEVTTIMLMERRDGRRIYFNALRTLADGSKAGAVDVCYAERTTTGWGPPVSAGPGVNSQRDDRSPSLTADDVLYFEREGQIYRSRSTDGRYAEASALPIEGPTFQPFVSRDGSYLLFWGTGASTTRIAFRQANGSWSAGLDVPDTIPTRGSLFPSVTPDGRYFFMAAGEVLRVDTGFLADLRARARQ